MKIPALVMYYFVRVREGVPKRVNARDENEINNTGFGVNRYLGTGVYTSTKFSSTAYLSTIPRYRYRYSCTGTGAIMISSLHTLCIIS